MNPGFNDLFPTPILYGKINNDDLTAKVINELLTNDELANTSDTYGTTNILFESDSIVLDEFEKSIVLPAFDEYLKNTIGKSLTDFRDHTLNAWASGSGYDYSLDYHNHKGSHLSSVFYLLAEEKESGGEIVFTDPRTNANRGYMSEFNQWFEPIKFLPSSGDYLIFPSYLYHYVKRYNATNRIKIVVDLFLIV